MLRAVMPWTVTQQRWLHVAEGLALLALIFVSRDETLGGLRFQVSGFGGP